MSSEQKYYYFYYDDFIEHHLPAGNSCRTGGDAATQFAEGMYVLVIWELSCGGYRCHTHNAPANSFNMW